MKYSFVLLALILTVSACGPKPITKDGRYSQYASQTKNVAFGNWYIENCQMVMRVSDMQISSTGKMNADNSLTFKISTNLPLLALPSLSFNTVDWTPPVIGKNRNFTFDIPYNSTVAAEMVQDYAYLILTYQATDSRTLQQHFFKLAGVPYALAYLQKTQCSKG